MKLAIHKNNKKVLNFGLRDIYNNTRESELKFKPEKIRQKPNKKHKRKRVIMSYSLYRKIILTYLQLWIRDFFFSKESIYFPFTGKVEKYRSKKYGYRKDLRIGIQIRWIERSSEWFEKFTLFRKTLSYLKEEEYYINTVGIEKTEYIPLEK